MKVSPPSVSRRSTLHPAVFTKRWEAWVELDLLMKNIEHLQETVSMQQHYAQVTGFNEPMPPASPVEAAA